MWIHIVPTLLVCIVEKNIEKNEDSIIVKFWLHPWAAVLHVS